LYLELVIDPNRLRTQMALKAIRQSELARLVGVSQQTIGKLVKGNSQGSVHLHKIARALGTTPEYLTGESDETGDIDARPVRRFPFPEAVQSPHISYRAEPALSETQSVSIPEIDIGYSMGGGLVLQDHVEAKAVPFPREWLRSLIRGRFDQVFIARGEGDSMQPTLLDGDVIVVDTAQQAITGQDRLWCLSYSDLGMIKRVRALPDGGLEIISDNPAVRPFKAYDGEVQVIGRVVWVGRKM
jgi:phage repressor protein C with HTH and peptisase S24 domain